MKGIVFILSLYMGVLILTPCSDFEHLDEIQAEHYDSDSHNHSNECPDDDCSPLCSCACCQVIATSISFYRYYQLVPKDYITRQMPLYLDNYSFQGYHSLFRPPQFAV